MNYVDQDMSVQFSAGELMTLEGLRARYESGEDLFTEAELARLDFLRWLISTRGLGFDHGSDSHESGSCGRIAHSGSADSEIEIFDDGG